jgi:ribosomal protein S18 acetylase RimI-like enzyme
MNPLRAAVGHWTGRVRALAARVADGWLRPALGERGWDGMRRAVYALEEAADRRTATARLGATPADVAAGAAIGAVDDPGHAAFHAYLVRHGHDAAWLLGLVRNRGAVALAAWWKGRPVAHVLMVPRASLPDGRAAVQLVNLYVEPALRGHGLGRRLLVAFRERARREGAAVVRLAANRGDARAVGFYRAAGFRLVEGAAGTRRPGRVVLEADA